MAVRGRKCPLSPAVDTDSNGMCWQFVMQGGSENFTIGVQVLFLVVGEEACKEGKFGLLGLG